MKAMTYNVKTLTYKDRGNKSWWKRKERILNTIKESMAEIICLQEVKPPIQSCFFKRRLKGFKSTFESAYGNLNPFMDGLMILWDKSRFKMINHGKIPVADEKGNYFDARVKRIIQWVQLEDIKLKEEITVMNIHMDHRGEVSKEKEVEMIKKILSIKNRALIMGDFNITEEHHLYKKMTEMANDANKTALLKFNSEFGTANMFTLEAPPKENRIDFVFVTKNEIVKEIETILNASAGFFPSDHFPILIETHK